MNTNEPQGIIEKVFLRGKLTVLTGLRVGGTDQGLSVGGLQNIVVRHALLGEPYVPGSSIRGKIRCMLERLQGVSGRGHGDMIQFGPCNDANLLLVQLFGTESATIDKHEEGSKSSDAEPAKKKSVTIPSRLLVRDAHLTQESRKLLSKLRGDLPMTETKTEVCIDRVTSEANPRTFERVPAGAELAFEMVLEVRALPPGSKDSKDPRARALAIMKEKRHQKNHWGRDEDIESLLTGLDLLQDDALGGQGSRGYGRVKVTLDPITVRTRDAYQNGGAEKGLELKEKGKKLFDNINERGKEERAQVFASLGGVAP